MPYTYEFKEEEVPSQDALCIRRTTTLTNLDAVLKEIFGEVAEYLRELKLESAGPPFACYHSIGPDQVDIEAGYPVDRPGRSRWQIRAVQLAGGPAVVISHVGPYEPVTYANEALKGWLSKHHREAKGPLTEVHLTDPVEAPASRQRRIKIVQRLK